MSFSLPSSANTYTRQELFGNDSDDEELITIMGDFMVFLENGDSSTPLTRVYIPRDQLGAGNQLMNDYFVENSKYPPHFFRRRFCMRKELFMRIANDIASFSPVGDEHVPPHFVEFRNQRVDARGNLGFSTIQKCTSAIRQLAYGNVADSLDEYLQMGEQTSRDALDAFCKCVFDLYREEYLRRPTTDDIQRIYQKYAELHGFPGMLGSINCMHWPWKRCPKAWQGQFTRGDKRVPTIMLEAVASYDLWIWHAFFGTAGSNNDINVLNQSHLFREIVEDTASDTSFTVNGTEYKKGYYLADGIYPEWATFVKVFSCPQDLKKKKFKKYQESARKDVERAFGVLQGRWAILTHPSRSFSVNKIRRTMYACVIWHNMIVEDSGHAITSYDLEILAEPPPSGVPVRTHRERMAVYARTNKELRDRGVHHGLRHDLVEHIWRLP
uniref:uncharacterized protein LOC122611026 n=1 Tax=Erigeron canadensis TaxID=72917 RepID=UPI001CB9BDB8|nr:uncharacterized protein LOC122611026 [Erigeron canadensis]